MPSYNNTAKPRERELSPTGSSDKRENEDQESKQLPQEVPSGTGNPLDELSTPQKIGEAIANTSRFTRG